ncbi:hypothetical protein [Halarcobacter sp.]|uniref:hypothetical protein n=1 Tax=Halarcobacter sp. TaxID=2321133 RepID=UPI0029F4BFA1|nr:hypothetical protein [Halarcobacter sp.]
MSIYKKIVKFNLLSTLIVLILVLGALFVVYFKLLPSKIFFEDKKFKSIHMDKFVENKDLDIIFIGSSRTQNQLSSNLFEKNGFSVYNYGVPGMKISDFPFAVYKAVEKKPKYIFLNIELNDFYEEVNTMFPTYIDREFFNSDFKYISSNDYLNENFRIKDIFRQIKTYYKNHEINKFLNSYQKSYIAGIDCNAIYWRGNILDRSVLFCDNGDGIIFNKQKLKTEKKDIDLKIKKINDEKINILNRLIFTIKSNGIIPIVLLEPISYNTFYKYNKEYFNRVIDSKIIYLLDFQVNNANLWADINHFNVIGRKIYSEKILNEFKEIQKVK